MGADGYGGDAAKDDDVYVDGGFRWFLGNGVWLGPDRA